MIKTTINSILFTIWTTYRKLSLLGLALLLIAGVSIGLYGLTSCNTRNTECETMCNRLSTCFSTTDKEAKEIKDHCMKKCSDSSKEERDKLRNTLDTLCRE